MQTSSSKKQIDDRKTIFCDLDGTVFLYCEDFIDAAFSKSLKALPDVAETMSEWHCRGYHIVLTTARPEGMRPITVEQLKNAGIIYDQLVMGISAGPRYLINDFNPLETPDGKAFAINVLRNVDGLSFVNI